jgi:hypothetical protein
MWASWLRIADDYTMTHSILICKQSIFHKDTEKPGEAALTKFDLYTT